VIFLKDGKIDGEYRMPVYGTDDAKERRAGLQRFLDDMGW
jgi:putative ABC transport system ATP-binding protein